MTKKGEVLDFEMIVRMDVACPHCGYNDYYEIDEEEIGDKVTHQCKYCEKKFTTKIKYE